MKQKYEVTFHLVNGEIGHIIEAKSLVRARDKIKNHFEEEINTPVIALTDDLVLVKQNIQYYTVKEYEA